ncbi:hypothetical protein LguiA_013884 [Lonicera macranthoides]
MGKRSQFPVNLLMDMKSMHLGSNVIRPAKGSCQVMEILSPKDASISTKLISVERKVYEIDLPVAQGRLFKGSFPRVGWLQPLRITVINIVTRQNTLAAAYESPL